MAQKATYNYTVTWYHHSVMNILSSCFWPKKLHAHK